MAQFDVYQNPSKHTRKTYPYILDIQNSLIEALSTRIVVPLGDAQQFKSEELRGLTPKVEFEDKTLMILMPQISSMPAKLLNEPVGTLVHLRDEIISALDFAITGI